MGDERGEQTKELERLEEAAEETAEPEEIKKAAESPSRSPLARGWFIPYVIMAAMIGSGLFLLDWQATRMAASVVEKIRRYLLGGLSMVVVLAVARGIEVYAIARVRNAVSRFNLKRILRLVVALVLAFLVVSVLFVNWYTAVVSLGLISLVLGFALQTPISSFIGWIYILLRAPYRVGDRIEIGEARGDGDRRGIFGHDVMGNRRAASLDGSSQRAAHQVSEYQCVQHAGLQLLVAAVSIRVVRNQVSYCLRERPGVRGRDHATDNGGGVGRVDDGKS
jgi:hypothetical protein